MAFNEIEVKRIDKIAGEFCRNMVPEKLRKELRYNYRIEDQNVILYEDRPRWDNPAEWLALEFAKLRYNRQKASGNFNGSGPAESGIRRTKR
jgi:hypothetical protein